MKKRYVLVPTVAIFIVWLLVYILSRYIAMSDVSEPTNTLFNMFNVLFTALAFTGVIGSLYYQTAESRRASKELVERSILELFTIYTASDFQKTKDHAFFCLLLAVKDSQYARFLTSRLFPIERRPFPDSVMAHYKTLKPELADKSREELIDYDRAARLKLDDALNFFAMLSHKEAAKDVIKHVDFAYDWWRPTLWLIAQLQKEHREQHASVQQYCRNPLLHVTLSQLDAIYGYPLLTTKEEIYGYLRAHPWLQEQHIDPAFFEAKP